jgi:hypothetical protein
VIAGIVVVVLLAVGLPLLAWWVGGRRFWSRAHGAVTGDIPRRMMQKHALRPAEIAQVEGALAWGRELRDERLRAAVVDWAQELQRAAEERRRRHPRRQRSARALLGLWGTLLVLVAGLAVAAGRWGLLVQQLMIALALGPVQWMVERGPRRALQRNTGPPSERALPQPR